MTPIIGLDVGREAVRALVVRGSRVIWAGAAPPGELRELLAAAPVWRWPRPVVSAAIGPHGAQVKLLTGLPEIDDAQTLSSVIRENASAYFLGSGGRLLMSRVRPVEPGKALASAFDAALIDAIVGTCRDRGWRLSRAVPVAVALARALEEGSFTWIDDSAVVEGSAVAGTLTTVRTRAAVGSVETALSVAPEALAGLGPDAARYAAAYGAAMATQDRTLVLGRTDLVVQPPLRRRLIGPVLAAGIAVVAFTLSPLGAYCAAHGARRSVEDVRSGKLEIVANTHSQVARTTAILQAAHDFTASRANATALLASLADALPDSSVIMGFDWHDDSVELQIAATKPAAVLAAIGAAPLVGATELVGAVRREGVAGRVLQRMVVRFTVIR